MHPKLMFGRKNSDNNHFWGLYILCLPPFELIIIQNQNSISRGLRFYEIWLYRSNFVNFYQQDG